MYQILLIVLGSLFLYNIHKRHSKPIEIKDKVNNVKTIKDVVRLLQSMGSKAPTEDICEKLVNNFKKNPPSESCLITLSNLHKQYGNDSGMNGYAINMLWSCVVFVNSLESD